MKKFKMLAVMALSSMATLAFAQDKTEQIKVLGNCGMCKNRIEKGLKITGVTTATWDKNTKILSVTYDSTKINNEGIQQKIADLGHDTPKFKARDEVYAKLPGCCKYDRSGKTDKAH